jgi:hypothetical protein
MTESMYVCLACRKKTTLSCACMPVCQNLWVHAMYLCMRKKQGKDTVNCR